MEIQKESEAFEAHIKHIHPDLPDAWYKRDENGRYPEGMQQDWELWQAATAQVVPEGFVLVDKHQLAQLMANMDSFGKKALGDDYVSFADIAAVLDEAQEQSHV